MPTMLQGPLACSGEYKTKAKTTMTVQNFSLTLSVLSAKTMFKRTGSTMFGVFNLRVGSGVHTDATTPINVRTCSALWEGYNP